MDQTITSLLQRLWDDNERDGIEQAIRKHDLGDGTIATLKPGFARPLSPMLQERFQFAYEWKEANVGKTWLGLDRIERGLQDPEVKKLYDLRVENWERFPPAASTPENTALYGVDLEEYNETYLLWVGDQVEPQVFSFFDAQVQRFLDLKRFLEYIVGDRTSDDNDPDMFSTEGKNYKLV